MSRLFVFYVANNRNFMVYCIRYMALTATGQHFPTSYFCMRVGANKYAEKLHKSFSNLLNYITFS